MATSSAGEPPKIVHFESDKLSAGHAERCPGTEGTPLVSYPLCPPPAVRIVDPETQAECPDGTVGEIWVYGDNVSDGYWNRPTETERTFGGTLVAPSAGTPEGPWLRTGDLGFISEGELFIIGRIKDLLIVYGRNHSPDDIEATIQEITRGRCVAIAVPNDDIEQLVAIIELKMWGATDEDAVASWVSSNVKSPRRYRPRMALAWRISFWFLLARFPSPQAARSDEPSVYSCTETTSSAA